MALDWGGKNRDKCSVALAGRIAAPAVFAPGWRPKRRATTMRGFTSWRFYLSAHCVACVCVCVCARARTYACVRLGVGSGLDIPDNEDLCVPVEPTLWKETENKCWPSANFPAPRRF